MQEEQKCKSHYVQHTASKFYGVTKHWYLYCNRSGITRLRGEGKCKVVCSFVGGEDVFAVLPTGYAWQVCVLPVLAIYL